MFDITTHTPTEKPSEKSFGIVFSIVFLVIALYSLIHSNEFYFLALVVSVIFILLAFQIKNIIVT